MKQRVVDEIARFVTESSANRLPDSSSPYFDTPLTGFSAANDPLFTSYKKIIGDFHLTPTELFAGEFGEQPLAGTVISWILPITEAVRTSNRSENEYPSRAWAQTRNFGEGVNSGLRRHLVDWLHAQGHRAVAPQLSSLWKEFPETPQTRDALQIMIQAYDAMGQKDLRDDPGHK